MSASLGPDYFRDVYERQADPWNFETSPYEDAKYTTTLESLPKARYATAFELGCSIGVLTERLARRCDALLAVDVSDQALARARERCRHLAHVTFERMQLPADQPPGIYDLIVVSEVAYYWNREDLEAAMLLLARHHRPGGNLILVHWTPVVPDYPLTGDAVHDLWLARPEYRHVHGERAETYRLDVLERVASTQDQG